MNISSTVNLLEWNSVVSNNQTLFGITRWVDLEWGFVYEVQGFFSKYYKLWPPFSLFRLRKKGTKTDMFSSSIASILLSKSIHNEKCHHILFYHPKKLLYQLYHTILQYTQHPISYLHHLFSKILISQPLSLSSSPLSIFSLSLSSSSFFWV